MKLFVNFLLFSSFIALVSFSTFYPLSLVRVSSPASGLSILGESTGPNALEVRLEDGQQGKVISVTGTVYPGQNTYYNNAFRLTNQTTEAQVYKLVVLKTYPLGKGLTMELSTTNGGQDAVLAPNSSTSINVRVNSSGTGAQTPFKFTAKILTLNLN